MNGMTLPRLAALLAAVCMSVVLTGAAQAVNLMQRDSITINKAGSSRDFPGGPRSNGPRLCPPGTTGIPPRCVQIGKKDSAPRLCPPGMVGHPPKCMKVGDNKGHKECPPGTKGRWPRCSDVSSNSPGRKECPAGTKGRWPRCVDVADNPGGGRDCPTGTRGKYPNCVKVTDTPGGRDCPTGTRGKYPNCVKVTDNPNGGKDCPRGTTGKYPDCVKVGTNPPIDCPPGSTGRPPNCTQVGQGGDNIPTVCPPGMIGKPPRCVQVGTAGTDNAPCPPGMIGTPPRCRPVDGRTPPGGFPGPGGIVGPIPGGGPGFLPPVGGTGGGGGGGGTANTDTPGFTPAPTPGAEGQLPPLTPTNVEVPRFRPNELVVMVRAAQPDNVAATLAQSFNVNLLETVNLGLLPNVRIYRFRIPDNRSVEGLAAAMGNTPEVTVEPNFFYRLQGGEAPVADQQAPQYALPKMRVPDAQALATGKGVTIAVIDSGVDAKHPAFAHTNLQLLSVVEGDEKTPPDKHGTSIAGIIGGKGGVRGVAPDAKIIAVRAFAPEGENMPPVTDSLRLARSVDAAFKSGARVFNMSFAGPRDQLLIDMIDAAYAQGATFIAAVGNEGPGAPPAFPAAYNKVIAITATDESDRLYTKANRGNYVTASAPGVDIIAPVTGEGFDLQTGTSFAAAHVTGIVAMLKERNPQLTPEDMRRILTATARTLSMKEATEQKEDYGAGLADAYASLQQVQTNPLQQVETK